MRDQGARVLVVFVDAVARLVVTREHEARVRRAILAASIETRELHLAQMRRASGVAWHELSGVVRVGGAAALFRIDFITADFGAL